MTSLERPTAGAGLQRLLLVLPLAAQGDGAEIDELAGELGVEPGRILKDLQEVESRSYYLPAGLGDQIQLAVTSERLEVWTTGEFKRPVRLTPREALALELALRVGAPPAEGEDEESGEPGPVFEELRERLVEALRSPTGDEEPAEVALGGVEAGDDPLRERVQAAVHGGRVLRIVYRPQGREPGDRTVGPLLLVHAEGHWYLLARDLDLGDQRAFRMDRLLEAEPTGEDFTPEPEDERAVERFLHDGRVHGGGGAGDPEPFEAVVDYSAGIARWIREHGWEHTQELPDGGVRVRHRVLDPEWLLRHVLSYGPDAEVVEPDWMRRRMMEVVGRMAAGPGGEAEAPEPSRSA